MIDPILRHEVHEVAQRIGDGRPEFRTFAIPTLPTKPRPCSAEPAEAAPLEARDPARGCGYGECDCEPKPVNVRVASDNFQATCDICESSFKRK
jgi:hypothetical protein